MIFIPSLRSKQLNKASKFRNLINMARLDWKLIKFWKFDFVQKSNLICIKSWLILAQINSKSIQYIYTMHSNCKKKKNCSETLIPNSKKPCHSSKWESNFQPFSIVFEVSNSFLDTSRSESDLYFAKIHSESWNQCWVCSWNFKIRFLTFMHY